MKKIILIAMLCALASFAVAQDDRDAQTLFADGGAAYRNGQYDQAIQAYELILSLGQESGAIYYNLGNAYFKKNDLGKASLHYERAHRLIPRDADLEANLRFAREYIKEYGSVKESALWRRLMPHLEMVSTDEIIKIICLLIILASSLYLLGLFLHWQSSTQITLVIIFSFLLLFHCFIFGVKSKDLANQGIVLKMAEAKFEPIDNATVHYQLGEGSTVRLLKEKEGWWKVQRQDGKIGWIPAELAEEI